MNRDDEVKQAVGAVVKLAGFQIKRVATTDDLKERTLTIVITRVSEGWVQQRMEFEDEPPMLVTTDANGHVETITKGGPDVLDPSDLTETDETRADPDERAHETLHIEPDGVVAAGEEGPQLSEPEEAAAAPTVVDINSKKRR